MTSLPICISEFPQKPKKCLNNHDKTKQKIDAGREKERYNFNKVEIIDY